MFDYTFTSHTAPLNLDQLFTKFVGHLMDLYDDYDLELSCEYVSITFTPLEGVNHEAPLKNVNSIPFKKNIVNVTNIRKAFKSSILPLTLDENFYGRRSYSTRVFTDEKNGVKRVVTDISPTESQKDVFLLSSDTLIESFVDEKIGDDLFIRHNTDKKTSVTIKGTEIIKSSLTKILPLIKHIPKKHKNTFNKHIGSFDLETYFNNITQKDEVYAAGFCYGGNNVMISEPEAKTYYLDKGKTSFDIVIECINEMLKTKYKNAIFYTHNLGGYDAVFVLKILSEYNDRIGEKYFKFNPILKDKRILKLEISAKISKSVNNTITLVDSLALLPTTLEDLGKAFTTKYKKPLFPYSFVSNETLHYVGCSPSIEFYTIKTVQIPLDEYNKIKKDV
jgi:hypothetical protein